MLPTCLKHLTPRHSTRSDRCRKLERRRFRPRVEGLEDRVVPATLNIAGSVLTYTPSLGDNNALTISTTQIISNLATQFTFTDSAGITLGSGATTDGWSSNSGTQVTGNDIDSGALTIDIALGNGTDTLDVASYQCGTVRTGGSINISMTGGGRLAITLGGPGTSSLPSFNDPVNISNPTNDVVSLVVDDSGDPTGQTWNVGANQITVGGSSAINYPGSALSTLTVKGGVGGNTITVTGTSAPTTVFDGAGTNTVNVQATTAPLTFAQSSHDTITLHGNSGVQAIQGAVTVEGAATLTVDDTGDNLGSDGATITDGSVTGLAPAPIFYGTSQQVQNLVVQGANGKDGNSFTIAGSLAQTTTLHTGQTGQPSSVYVESTTSNVTIDPQARNDAIVIGEAGSVQALRGTVTVNTTGSGNRPLVTIDDSADEQNFPDTTINCNASVNSQQAVQVTQLAPAPINFTGNQLGSLLVKGGTGSYTFIIDPEADFVAPNALAVSGGGNGALVVDDTADGGGRGVTVAAGSIQGYQLREIDYIGSQWTSLTVKSGIGSSTYTVTNTSTPTTIVSGAGSDRVNVQGSTQPLTLTDPTTVVVGSNNRLEAVSSQVTVNGNGSTALTVNDSNENTHQIVAISSNWITGLGGASVLYTGLSPTSGLTFDGGTGGDTLDIQTTTVPTTFNGKGGDSITIGNGGSVQGILGAVTITGSQESVTVDDSADTTSTGSVVIGSSSVTGIGSAAAINYTGSQLASLTVKGSAAGGEFDITGTSTPTTLQTGDVGSDSNFVILGGVAGVGAQNVTSPVTISGPAGSIELLVGDSQNPGTGATITVTGSAITGLAPATISYQESALGFALLELNGAAANTLVLDDSADTTSRNATLFGPAGFFGPSITGMFGPFFTYSGTIAALTVKDGSGGNSFTVSGTTVPTTLVGGSGIDKIDVTSANNPVTVTGGANTTLTVDDSGDAGTGNVPVTLTSTSLTGLPQGPLTFSNLASVNVLLGKPNYNVNVSSFTGNASLTNQGGGSDTVTASENASFMLTDSHLSVYGQTSSASIALSGIASANLASTGGVGHVLDAMFFSGSATLSGGAGNNTLVGGSGTDTVTETADDNFTLTNALLTGTGATAINDTLVNIKAANLSVPATSTVNHTLNAATFSGRVTLTGGAGNDTLTGGLGGSFLSGGKGTNKLVGGKGTNEVFEAQDASFVFTGNTKLTASNGGAIPVLTDTLTGINAALLVDTNTTGTGRTLDASKFTGNATLVGGAGNDTLLGSNGNDSIDGGGGTANLLQDSVSFNLTLNGPVQGKTGNYTVTNVQLANLKIVSGNHSINAAGFGGKATLQGGIGSDTLIAGTGNDSLKGGTGNNVLLGGSGNDTLAGGTGHNLLIGGSGTSSLLGGNAGDILIAGTTAFDSQTQAGNFAAVNAIMAEWTSADSYSTKIARLSGTQTGGKNGTTLLTTTTVTTPNDTTVDTLVGGTGLEWFLALSSDSVARTSNETLTVIP